MVGIIISYGGPFAKALKTRLPVCENGHYCSWVRAASGTSRPGSGIRRFVLYRTVGLPVGRVPRQKKFFAKEGFP